MAAVSILVPTYNRRDYLKQCIDSLLTTTVPCEIIVSDNASTDGTAELMAGYNDPRLRYIRQPENMGGLNNYNFLLQAATKDYICLFGDDDIALPGCFEKKLAILDRHPHVSGVYSIACVLDADGHLAIGSKVNGVPEFGLISGRHDFDYLLMNCCISWQTLVFRRELYEEVGLLQESERYTYAIDWDFLIQISQGREFAFINEPTVGIRFHDANASVDAQGAGHLVRDTLGVWRKWLLDSENPPKVTGFSWKLMASVLAGAVQVCFGQDSSRLKAALAELDGLKQAYFHRMEKAFYAEMQSLLGNVDDLAADGLPAFRRGLTPFPLDTHKQVLFFHHPTWRDDRWKQVIAEYVQAFQPTDDVELVLWLDPDQGLSVETVGGMIATQIIEMGLNPQYIADIQLIAEPMDLEAQARLYTAMHVIVPAGDTRQLDRGAKLGRIVMTRMGPEAWRRAAERFLGAGALSPMRGDLAPNPADR